MKKHFLLTLALIALAGAVRGQGTVDVRFNGATASVSVPAGVKGVSYVTDGADVVITSTTTDTEYTYRLSGTSADGSLRINGQYKLTLQLDGLTLTNARSGAVIDVECGKRIDVELVDGTVSTLTDAAEGSQKGAFYFKGHPEFQGHGTLTVTGRKKHAIAAKEYIELKPSLGIINIIGAPGDGIHCGCGAPDPEKNFFLMRGGTVNIVDVQGDGIDADDYGAIRLQGGAVSTTVADGATGLKADSTLVMDGGVVNIRVVGSDAEGIRSNYSTTLSGGRIDISVEGDGSKGLKAKDDKADDATVSGGGLLTVSGGSVSITAQGGTLTNPDSGETDRCMAISTDADYVQTGGDVRVHIMGLEAATHNVKGKEQHQGGAWTCTRQPWITDAREGRYEMTLFVAVSRDGQPLADLTDMAVGAFFGNQCIDCADFVPGENYGILRLRSALIAVSEPVMFRLYDYATSKEYQLQTREPVMFMQNTVGGSPSEPVMLNLDTSSEGVGSVTLNPEEAPAYDLLGRPAADTTRPGIYVREHRKQLVR